MAQSDTEAVKWYQKANNPNRGTFSRGNFGASDVISCGFEEKWCGGIAVWSEIWYNVGRFEIL